MRLTGLPGLVILTPTHPSLWAGIVSFAVPNRDHAALAAALAAEDGVVLRHVAHRGAIDALRVSLHAYSDLRRDRSAGPRAAAQALIRGRPARPSMPRIELMMSLFAGACGGLVGVLWNGIVSAALLRNLGLPAAACGRWREPCRRCSPARPGTPPPARVQGLLFWAGWSLIALVHMPWYLVGVSFGLLCWSGVALPALLSLRLRLRVPTRYVLASALEWLVSCGAVGLFCAYSWQRIV